MDATRTVFIKLNANNFVVLEFYYGQVTAAIVVTATWYFRAELLSYQPTSWRNPLSPVLMRPLVVATGILR